MAAARKPLPEADREIAAKMPAAEKVDGRKLRGETRRSAVLEAARTLFIERGYRGTTLAQIIMLAGGSRETIYKTLGGKVGIFAAIVAETGEQVAASIIAPDAMETPPREELTRLGMDLAALWRSSEAKAAHEVVLSEGLNSPELIDAWYSGGNALVIDALKRYFTAQMRDGCLLPLDASLVARQFLTLLMGELAFPFIAGQRHAVDTLTHVERCVDLIIRAYGTTPATR